MLSATVFRLVACGLGSRGRPARPRRTGRTSAQYKLTAGTVGRMPTMMPATTRLKWAVVGWAAGFVGSLVGLIAVVALGGVDPGGEDALSDLTLGALVLLQVPLWIGLLGTPLLARSRGLNWSEQMGWRMRPVDAPLGVAVGLLLQFVLLPLLYLPILEVFEDLDVEGPARELTGMAEAPMEVAALVFMTVIAAPLTEEVFFRGLVQGALRDRFGPVLAVVVSSLAFAVVHFQLVQFPALLVIGAVHALLVLFTGRLGAALWSHVAFNAATVIVLLA